MSTQWYEFKLRVTPDTKEAVSNYLFEVGAEGINENLSDPNLLQAYFPFSKKEEALKQIKEFWNSLLLIGPKLPQLNLVVSPVPEENWSENYKKYYVAQYLTDLFFLRPKWDRETSIPKGMIPIIMDPGQAFGTGLHPSTQLCLKTIQSQILDNIQRERMHCLDVGTGTGILGLAAYHLGVEKVVAIDNDPIAIEVAKQTMELNQISGVELSTTDIKKVGASFDFVISNILLETHRELKSEYARLLPQGGLLLLSGLLGYQRRELLDFILPQGFVLLESRNFQEWAAFLFVRRDPN